VRRLPIAVYTFAELFAELAAGFIAHRQGMKLMLLSGLIVLVGGSLMFLVISPRLLLLVRYVQ
jgi:MFS family permease